MVSFKKIFTTVILLGLPISLWAENKIRAILVKGEVLAGNVRIKKGDLLQFGDHLTTKEKSMARLKFPDGSTITLSPKTSIELTRGSTKRNKTSLIQLLKGKVRAKVQKKRALKSKFFIRTKTAALGVRGTDFLMSYNAHNSISNVITFSGEVSFKENNGNSTPVIVKAGNFSIVSSRLGNAATIPTKVNPQQFHLLKQNPDFRIQEAHQRTSEVSRSHVLPVFAIQQTSAQNEIEKSFKIEQSVSKGGPPPQGASSTASGRVIPPAGGYLDTKTGHYIAPPPGSRFDSRSNTFVPPPSFGSVNPDSGQYVPPPGYELQTDGEFVQIDNSIPQLGPEPELVDAQKFGSEFSETSDVGQLEEVSPTEIDILDTECPGNICDEIEELPNSVIQPTLAPLIINLSL